MQKSFNLACFIWNYARLSNPAKYLLRVREAGALGLLSADRRIPATRPQLPALGRIRDVDAAGVALPMSLFTGDSRCTHLPSPMWFHCKHLCCWKLPK